MYSNLGECHLSYADEQRNGGIENCENDISIGILTKGPAGASNNFNSSNNNRKKSPIRSCLITLNTVKRALLIPGCLQPNRSNLQHDQHPSNYADLKETIATDNGMHQTHHCYSALDMKQSHDEADANDCSWKASGKRVGNEGRDDFPASLRSSCAGCWSPSRVRLPLQQQQQQQKQRISSSKSRGPLSINNNLGFLPGRRNSQEDCINLIGNNEEAAARPLPGRKDKDSFPSRRAKEYHVLSATLACLDEDAFPSTQQQGDSCNYMLTHDKKMSTCDNESNLPFTGEREIDGSSCERGDEALKSEYEYLATVVEDSAPPLCGTIWIQSQDSRSRAHLELNVEVALK